MSAGNGKHPAAFVMIAMPVTDTMPSRTTFDLIRLVAYTDAFGFSAANDGILSGHHLEMDWGTLIAPQRRLLVHKALADDRVTHILWVDSDMRFPKDSLIRLLGRRKPIVAANYATRRGPISMTAFRTLKRGDHVYTEQDATGLGTCAAVGMGLMLTETDVFRKTEPPWFTLDWVNGGYQGEDITFAKRCHAAGYDIWLDHDLSKEVRHIGQRELTYQHALTTRDLAAAEALEEAAAEDRIEAVERSLTLVRP